MAACLLRLTFIIACAVSWQPAVATAQSTRETYLTSPALLRRALDTWQGVADATVVSRLEISPDALKLRARAPGRPDGIDEWSVGLFRRLAFDRDIVRGPSPIASPGIVPEVETSFFRLSDLTLEAIADVGRRAVARAALDDPAEVAAIMVERGIELLPVRRYGPVRWTIDVRSPRETARIFAEPGGHIFGADLSGTNRARRFNPLGRDDWPAVDAAAELLAAIGPEAVVHELRVYDKSLYVEADHPTDARQTRSYSWDLSGVRRGLVDVPNLVRTVGIAGREPFRLAEVDLAILPELKRRARAALSMPNQRIASLTVEKSKRRPGKPAAIWTIEIEESPTERGVMTAAADATVLDVVLPESRRPVEPFLAPATLAKTLGRLRDTFGADARVTRLLINDRHANLAVEDPIKPGSLTSFVLDAKAITRSMTPLDDRIPADEVFTLAEIEVLTANRLAELAGRTRALLPIEGGDVFRYTIFRRNAFYRSRQGRPLVEVRTGRERQGVAGWMVFELDGQVLDIVRP